MGDSIPQSIGVTTLLDDLGVADPCETGRRQISLPIAEVRLIDADTRQLAVMAKRWSRLPLSPSPEEVGDDRNDG
ncbi:MAG: hypothetical protein Q8L49_06970 [Burkholderiaceae bacterium]|nr:hypothetical protein [Burkholderiaceae bacterium]